jgi:hypothetical protein
MSVKLMKLYGKTNHNESRAFFPKLLPAALIVLLFTLSAALHPAFAQSAKDKKLQKNLQKEITLSASVGIENTFFPLHLNPVDITINNGTGANFEGEILIEAAGRRYRLLNVFTGPLSSKKYSVNTRFDTYTHSVKVSIINSSNIVIYDENIPVKPNQTADYYVFSVSDAPSYANALKSIRGQKRSLKSDYGGYGSHSPQIEGAVPRIVVQNVKAEEMFANFACYEPYSLIIINGADASLMNADQQRAVIEYVRGGGALMVSYGGFVSKLAASELASILPVTISGSEVADGSDFYKYAASQSASGAMNDKFAGIGIPISVGEIKNGASATVNLTAPDGRVVPIIAHSRVGNGIVYYAAFDISQVDILQIDYLKDNIASILKQSETGKEFKISSLAMHFNRFCEKFNQFATNPPSVFMVLLMLVLFAAITGPLFYFYVRNSVSMTKLIVVPTAVSLAFFAAFNFFDFEFMLDKPLIAELGLRMIDNDSANAQAVSGIAILIPPMSAGEYSVDQSGATLMGNARGYYSQEESEIIINEDLVKLVHPQMNYRFSKYAIVKNNKLNGKFGVGYSENAAETDSGPGGWPAGEAKQGDAFDSEMRSYMTAAARNKKAKKLISIVNNTDMELVNCKIYYCGHVFTIDKLYPGEKITPGAPKSFDSPKMVDSHFDAIAESIKDNLPQNLKFNAYSYNYNTQSFMKTAGIYIAKNSAASPIMVGYMKKGGGPGESVRTSGCSVSDLGAIALIKL